MKQACKKKFKSNDNESIIKKAKKKTKNKKPNPFIEAGLRENK